MRKLIEITPTKEYNLEVLIYRASQQWATFIHINELTNGDLRFILEEKSTVTKQSVDSFFQDHDPNEYIAEKYVEYRRKDYPSIEDQLDMQFWDQVNGTTLWRDTIQATKDRYPKPEST
jgi:hypothetical protein